MKVKTAPLCELKIVRPEIHEVSRSNRHLLTQDANHAPRLSRFIVSLFACPFLYLYLSWQNKTMGVTMENRPVLTILKELSEIRVELSLAQREIEHRKAVEREKEELIRELQRVLSEVKTLRGFLPICANCKKIRDDEGYWQQIEQYVEEHSEAVFSHGLCPDCADSLYPGLRKKRNP